MVDGVKDGGEFSRLVGCLFNGIDVCTEGVVHVLECTRDLFDSRADLCQLIADLVDGVLGLFGELAHLIGNDGKATSMLSGTCRLDGGIECEQIRLFRDTVDRDDEVVNARCALMERLYILCHLREPTLCRIRLFGDLMDACLREIH